MSMKQTWFNHNKKPKTPISPRTPRTPRTPKSPTSPTVKELFQAERPSNYFSETFSPRLEKEPQQDEERFSFQTIKKASVLAKVKEKARKWRQNLGKKKQGQDGDPSSPSWGAFEDYENDGYHQRPSKLFTLRPSSNSYREGRSMSGLSINEKQVLSYSADRGYTEHCERIKEKVSPNNRPPSFGDDIKILMNDTLSPKQGDPPSYEEAVHEFKVEDITALNETKEETTDDFESEETDEEVKVMPLDNQEAVEEDKVLSQICMKLIQAESGKTPTPSPEDGAFEEEKLHEADSQTQIQSLAEAVAEKLATSSAADDSEETQMMNSEEEQEEEQKQDQEQEHEQEQERERERVLSLPTINTKKEDSVSVVDDCDQDNEESSTNGEKKWDKGVSVKEYIKNKLEPGEDERALSQVISEAISPRRTPGDKGVIEKVKEAVTLLLLAEQKQMEREQEEKQKQQQQKQLKKRQQEERAREQQEREQEEREQEERERERRSMSQLMRHSSSSVQIPISTNPYEEDELNVEEECHGRILQAN